jgi:hypothetical protein
VASRRRRSRSLDRRLARIEKSIDELVKTNRTSPSPDWVAAMVREIVAEMTRERARR